MKVERLHFVENSFDLCVTGRVVRAYYVCEAFAIYLQGFFFKDKRL